MKKGKDERKIVVLLFILLRGENDSKQSGKIQAGVFPDCASRSVAIQRLALIGYWRRTIAIT